MRVWFHYAHLKEKPIVKVGDIVYRASQFAKVGSTGNSTSPHLHFEVWKDNPAVVGWRKYTFGMSLSQVKARYDDPKLYISTAEALPAKYDNYTGYGFLAWNAANSTYHAGIDINSGIGSQDLGVPVKTVANEKVIFIEYDAEGWGWHVFTELIEEESTQMERKPTQKVLVLNVGFALPSLDDYDRAREFVKQTTGGELLIDFVFENFPYEILPLTWEYMDEQGSYWGVNPSWQKERAAPGYKVVQLIYEASKMYGGRRVLSMAFNEGPGNQQHNQINGGFDLPVPIEYTILHEMSHSWRIFLGIPDDTHQIIKDNGGLAEPATRQMILSLKNYWSQLADKEGENMAKFFKVNDHGKLGIMILEGFSGTIIFENNFAEYQTLLKITGINDTTPTITIP